MHHLSINILILRVYGKLIRIPPPCFLIWKTGTGSLACRIANKSASPQHCRTVAIRLCFRYNKPNIEFYLVFVVVVAALL